MTCLQSFVAGDHPEAIAADGSCRFDGLHLAHRWRLLDVMNMRRGGR